MATDWRGHYWTTLRVPIAPTPPRSLDDRIASVLKVSGPPTSGLLESAGRRLLAAPLQLVFSMSGSYRPAPADSGTASVTSSVRQLATSADDRRLIWAIGTGRSTRSDLAAGHGLLRRAACWPHGDRIVGRHTTDGIAAPGPACLVPATLSQAD